MMASIPGSVLPCTSATGDWLLSCCRRVKTDILLMKTDKEETGTDSNRHDNVESHNREPDWPWLAGKVCQISTSYPNGITFGILMSEVELQWRSCRTTMYSERCSYDVHDLNPAFSEAMFCTVKLARPHKVKHGGGLIGVMLQEGLSGLHRFVTEVTGHQLLNAGRVLRIADLRMQTGWMCGGSLMLMRPAPIVVCLECSCDGGDLDLLSPDYMTSAPLALSRPNPNDSSFLVALSIEDPGLTSVGHITGDDNEGCHHTSVTLRCVLSGILVSLNLRQGQESWCKLFNCGDVIILFRPFVPSQGNAFELGQLSAVMLTSAGNNCTEILSKYRWLQYVPQPTLRRYALGYSYGQVISEAALDSDHNGRIVFYVMDEKNCKVAVHCTKKAISRIALRCCSGDVGYLLRACPPHIGIWLTIFAPPFQFVLTFGHWLSDDLLLASILYNTSIISAPLECASISPISEALRRREKTFTCTAYVTAICWKENKSSTHFAHSHCMSTIHWQSAIDSSEAHCNRCAMKLAPATGHIRRTFAELELELHDGSARLSAVCHGDVVTSIIGFSPHTWAGLSSLEQIEKLQHVVGTEQIMRLVCTMTPVEHKWRICHAREAREEPELD